MNKITAISLTTLTTMTTFSMFPTPAKASWGDFFLGVGAGVGTSIIINNNAQAQRDRYRPVSPQQEYYRGVQDGINGAAYDNPRNSPDYDRGFREGLRKRRG